MYNGHGQSGFHFRIIDLKASKQEHSFIFSATKAQTIKAQTKDQAAKESVTVLLYYCFRNSIEIFTVSSEVIYPCSVNFENFSHNCWQKPMNMFIW